MDFILSVMRSYRRGGDESNESTGLYRPLSLETQSFGYEMGMVLIWIQNFKTWRTEMQLILRTVAFILAIRSHVKDFPPRLLEAKVCLGRQEKSTINLKPQSTPPISLFQEIGIYKVWDRAEVSPHHDTPSQWVTERYKVTPSSEGEVALWRCKQEIQSPLLINLNSEMFEPRRVTSLGNPSSKMGGTLPKALNACVCVCVEGPRMRH